MKYTQYSRNKKGNSAFYITIALCLMLVGVAAWFAFSRMNNATVKPQSSSQQNKSESNIKEYQSEAESYTDSEPQTPSITTDPVDEEVTDEKYPTDTKPTKKEKIYTLPINGEILKDFSLKALQYSATYNDMRIHAAVDIACTEGTFVSSCTDGKIQAVEETADYGKCVTIDHGDGLIIKYCGLKNVSVKKDNPIKMGERIGAVGTVPCESSDQCHLHVEAYQNGKAVSILKFFE